jgi:hypothetical protein
MSTVRPGKPERVAGAPPAGAKAGTAAAFGGERGLDAICRAGYGPGHYANSAPNLVPGAFAQNGRED